MRYRQPPIVAPLLAAALIVPIGATHAHASGQPGSTSDNQRVGHISTRHVSDAATYNVADVYSVGISSGGYMATQLHVAYSDTIQGEAIFAAGPYYCAQGSLNQALYACMDDWQDDELQKLADTTRRWSREGRIDPVGNLADDPAYVFHGTNDTTIATSVNDDLVRFLRDFGVSTTYVDGVPAGHAWISPEGPNPCGSSYSPYVNDCDIDPQGALLRKLLGAVSPPTTGGWEGTLYSFSQDPYAPGYNAAQVSMGDTGFVYVPRTCEDGASCDLIIALHGCKQNYDRIGSTFIETAYLNEYADTNDLIVLYPQAQATWGSNPNACWDWWGYLGYNDDDYATHGGAQMATIMRMVHDFGG